RAVSPYRRHSRAHAAPDRRRDSGADVDQPRAQARARARGGVDVDADERSVDETGARSRAVAVDSRLRSLAVARCLVDRGRAGDVEAAAVAARADAASNRSCGRADDAEPEAEGT